MRRETFDASQPEAGVIMWQLGENFFKQIQLIARQHRSE